MKMIKCLSLVCCVLCGSTQALCSTTTSMVESVVYVNSSSGVIVYSDEQVSLALTVMHAMNKGTDEIVISLVGPTGIESFKTGQAEINTKYNLAIIAFYPGYELFSSQISRHIINIGEDVWTVSNPNKNFRSLKRGVLSSKDRSQGGLYLWEISGGVFIGSFGGGVFNNNKELVGIINSADIYTASLCNKAVGKDNCFKILLSEIGYIIPQHIVIDFVLSSRFGSYFEYLSKKE